MLSLTNPETAVLCVVYVDEITLLQSIVFILRQVYYILCEKV